MIRALRVLVLAAAVGVLAGCSTGSGFTDLEREATSADVLPSDLPAYAAGDLAEDSVRFAGEHDGVDYYLARLSEGGGVCVVVYRSAEQWVTGCGGASGVGVSGIGASAIAAPDGSPELDVGTRVGANIVVR
jgi:hypothetical protein